MPLLDSSEESDETVSFRSWTRAPYGSQTESVRFTKYAGMHWHKTQLLDRWRVITGTSCASRPVSLDLFDSPRLEGAMQTAQQELLEDVVDAGYREMSREAGDDQEQGFSEGTGFAVDRGTAQGELDPDTVWRQLGYPELADTSSVAWFDQFDFAATDLGPSDAWHPELKRLARMLLTDSNPAAVYWGPQRLTLYNEAYCWIVGR